MARLLEMIEASVADRCRRASLTPTEDAVRRCILQEFARTGRPPTVPEIAALLDLPPETTVSPAVGRLEEADLLRTRDSEIVAAYPFSAGRTAHTVTFGDGRAAYALCATDALGIHFMLGEDLTVRSVCPACGDEVVVTLESGRITAQEPAGAVEYVKLDASSGCAAEARCPQINLFCRPEHVATWTAEHPQFSGGETFTLEEALEDGRTIFGDLLKERAADGTAP